MACALSIQSLHAGINSYDAAIEGDNAGALTYVKVSRETMEFDGTAGIEFDFGEISESSTLEFIVSGDPEAAQDGFLAVGENGTWNLRYEQWDDTGALGFTHLGVADYLFEPAEGIDAEALNSPTEPTHLTYRWDQETTTMEVYLDGVLTGTNAEATEYEMPTGLGFLGAKDEAGAEGMTGKIERVTVYNEAIDPAAILFHAEAWLGNSDPGVVVSAAQDFGELQFIDAPQELTISVRNSGQENELTVSVVITGGENFTLVSAPSVVPPGGSGDIILLFDRKGAIGQFTGNLEIRTNDPDEFDQVISVALSVALIDREGPIGHYRLDEMGSATELPDATGFGRNGTYGEGVTLGEAAVATGTSLGVSGGSSASIPGEHFADLEDFTIGIWMNAESVDALHTLVAKGGGGVPTFAVLISEGTVQWFVESAPEFGTETAVLTAGTTHHVAISYSTTRATIYVDGAPVASLDDPADLVLDSMNPVMIGSFETALPFVGRLDDLQIYNRVLTDAQINGLFASPGSVVTGELSAKPRIAAQWSFDGTLSDNAPGGLGDVLTPTGDPEYALGVVGQAVKITADGLQRLSAEDSDDLDLAENWTLEAFVWPDTDNTGEWDRFWTKWGDGGEQWHTSFRSTGAVDVENGLDLFINDGNNIIKSNMTAEVPLQQWSHVAFIGDATGGTITTWLNGVKVGEAPYEAVTPGDGAMNFGNFESPANELQYSGLIDEAIIHTVVKDEAYLLERAALITIPKFYPIASITSSTEADDLYPVTNLILGPGVGYNAEAPFRRLIGGADGLWVTAAPGGFPADYIEAADAPVLILDIGADVSLGEISVWGYSSMNGNGVSEFSLRFATGAEGTAGFGQSIAYNPTFNPTTDNDVIRQSFLFSETVTARYVEFTPLDNYFTAPGDGSEGGLAGGDRVGLGEIAFEIEPSGGGGGGSRDSLGRVAGSSEAITEPAEVDFGELAGDATLEFLFNAIKLGPSTAIAGTDAWALKLEQWQDTGFIGTTEFGVVDNTSEAPTVFDADVHVVFVSDTAAGETRIYVDGVLSGSTPGNPEMSGKGAVMGARDGTTDPMGEGSIMYGWASYDSALSDADIDALADTPFGATAIGATLVAHWPLDDLAGATVAAETSGAHPGAVGAGITFGVPGAIAGTAAEFDGSGGIQAEWSAAINPESFTLTLWAKSNGGAGAWNSAVTSRNDLNPDSQGYLIYDNEPSGAWTFWSGNGTDDGNWQVIDGPEVKLAEWQHLAITYDDAAEVKKLYVDGMLEGESNDTLTPNDTTPFNIGAGQDLGDGFFFIGEIDDVSVWNGALDVDMIGRIMLEGVAAVAGGGDPVDPPNSDSFDLTAVGFSAAGDFSLTLPADVTADIEYSADLLNWEIIANGATGAFEDLDTGRNGAASGYYRAKP